MVLSTSLRGAGAVHVVDLSSGTLLRRIDTGLNPDVAVDRTGSHLLLLSSGNGTSTLSFIDLPSFAERKRISIEDRIQYIGIGPSSLLLSVDERLIFILHRKVLGDNLARVWLTAHDANSGQQRGQLDLGNCGASYLSQSPDARFLYATCGQSEQVLHILRADPLREEASIPIPFYTGGLPGWTAIAGAAVSPDGTRFVAVTRDLRLFVVELPSRKTEVITRWGKPGNIETRGIALDPNGSHVWIAVADPDQAVVKLDLIAGQLERASIPGLTSFAIIGDRILYTHGTRLHEFKGTLDVDLPAGFSGEEGHRRVLVAP
jgi:DNA-binding beta-propeller fold protein YncE